MFNSWLVVSMTCLLCNGITLAYADGFGFALQKTESPKLHSVIGVPFCPFQSLMAPFQARFSKSTPVSMGKSNTVLSADLNHRNKKSITGIGWNRMGRRVHICGWLIGGWLASVSEIQCFCGCAQSFGFYNWCFAFGCHNFFHNSVRKSQSLVIQKRTLITVVRTFDF